MLAAAVVMLQLETIGASKWFTLQRQQALPSRPSVGVFSQRFLSEYKSPKSAEIKAMRPYALKRAAGFASACRPLKLALESIFAA